MRVKTTLVRVFAIRDPHTNDFDTAFICGMSDSVCLSVGEHLYDDDAKHLEQWARDNGLEYASRHKEIIISLTSDIHQTMRINFL